MLELHSFEIVLLDYHTGQERDGEVGSKNCADHVVSVVEHDLIGDPEPGIAYLATWQGRRGGIEMGGNICNREMEIECASQLIPLQYSPSIAASVGLYPDKMFFITNASTRSEPSTMIW